MRPHRMGSPAYRVLVVDDESVMADTCADWLRSQGHMVDVATEPQTALARTAEELYDVIVLDMVMPGMDGLEFLRGLPQEHRSSVIVMSGIVTVRSAVEAMKLGAFDCILKTDGLTLLDVLVRRAAESRRRDRELQLLSRRVERQTLAADYIFKSAKMLKLLDVLHSVAASNVSVLLTGESGTGKDVIARTIHSLSPRAAGPYVDVNCAALSESLLEAELFGHEKGAFTGASSTTPGLVEVADGGTLLLDEVAEMPPSLQAKLLRMAEDRTLYRVGGRQRIHVDVRIVAATNRDLQKEIAAGRLREDLYYRLAGVEIHVPPLRERVEDIEPLALHYLGIAARQTGRGPKSFSPEMLTALQRHNWPGNVRELRNMMERIALLVDGPLVDLTTIPADIVHRLLQKGPAGGSLTTDSIRDRERHQIQEVLDAEGWHHGRAAARLGLPVRTLYRKIKAYNLTRPSREKHTSPAKD